MKLDELYKAIPEEGDRCLKNCGKCCVAAVPISKDEAVEILKWLGENTHLHELQKQFKHADTQKNMCPFLRPDKGCFVYEARPFVCRLFGHGNDERLPERVRQVCPEGVEFTQLSIPDLPNVLDWWTETERAGGWMFQLRPMEVETEDGKVVKV